MVEFTHFNYAGAPRTGTTWVLHAAELVGLGVRSKATVHIPHAEQDRSKLRVTTVRHPCDWLASYWAAIYPGCIGLEEMDILSRIDVRTFDQFVREYLKHYPGAVGRLFAAYQADTCLRLEDQPKAWIELMDSIGVENPHRCWELLRINRARRPKPHWLLGLWDQVMEAEAEMVDRFAY